MLKLEGLKWNAGISVISKILTYVLNLSVQISAHFPVIGIFRRSRSSLLPISTISCNEKKITENNTSFLSRQPQSIPGYQSNQPSLSCLLFIGYLDLKIMRLNKTTATKTVNVNKIQKSHHSRLKFDKKGQKHTVFSHAAKFSSWY